MSEHHDGCLILFNLVKIILPAEIYQYSFANTLHNLKTDYLVPVERVSNFIKCLEIWDEQSK